MSKRFPQSTWSLSGTMEKLDIQKYVEISLAKAELSFGSRIVKPKHGFIPYLANDQILSDKIEVFFSKKTEWRSISIEDLRDYFFDDYWTVFHFIGWRGIYALTPLMIKLAYEAYFQGDEIYQTIDNIFSKFPRFSDDQTASFLDWMAFYDRFQILCILDMMVLLSNDPLGRYPGGYTEGLRWWTRYLIDGPAGKFLV